MNNLSRTGDFVGENGGEDFALLDLLLLTHVSIVLLLYVFIVIM